MKCHVSLAVLLVGSLSVCLSLAERPSHMLKTRRSYYLNEPALLARSSDAAGDLSAEQDKPVAGSASGSNGNKDASSGRLFLKKFLTFKNMFGQNNQPVIPIIITSPGTTASPTSPTVTVTSTGTIPSGTGTITTSPAATGTTPTTPTTSGRQYNADAEDDDMAANDDGQEEQQADGAVGMAANAELLDEQAMQAALAAGAQEYEVFTDGDQAGDETKASQNNRINLRRKGGRRGQSNVISVRIPPRYRRYFKNGQKVMLNTKSRPNKRRVIRKRVQNKNKRFNNRRRGGKNKNKKNRGKGKNKNKRPRISVV